MQPTQIRELPLVVTVRSRPLWSVLVFAALVGVALGFLDRWMQDALPYPFANLANSAAVWAVVAFAVGLRVAHRAWHAAAAGVVTLGVAVETYYGASSVLHGDSLDALTARPTQFWLGFALVVGALFGAAGTWARDEDLGVRAVGLAFAPSVLFAEALNLARLSRIPGEQGTSPGATAAIEFVAGVVVLVALALFVARHRRDWLHALACSVPITLIGFGLYVSTGYGG